MTRRCSVMRMPLAAHRASISVVFGFGSRRFSVAPEYHGRGPEIHPPSCDQQAERRRRSTRSRRSTSAAARLLGPDSSPRGGRPAESRRADRAAAPARCLPRLRETPRASRGRRAAADADRAAAAPARARASRHATATDRISASSVDHARHDEAGKLGRCRRAMREHIAVDQQALDLVLAPAAVE